MITLFVIYCMVLNPTMCRTLELVPADHEIVSIPECIRGGAMGDIARFTLDHTQWQVKGWRCTERPTPMQAWLERHQPVD
jgi:hypothetical protein